MIIYDLNYLETVAEEASVVGGITNTFAKQVLIFEEVVDINKNVFAKVDVKGNLAFSEADSSALGKNTLSQTLTTTTAIEGYGSGSTSTSVAAAI